VPEPGTWLLLIIGAIILRLFGNGGRGYRRTVLLRMKAH
jgi:hypothetical protein